MLVRSVWSAAYPQTLVISCPGCKNSSVLPRTSAECRSPSLDESTEDTRTVVPLACHRFPYLKEHRIHFWRSVISYHALTGWFQHTSYQALSRSSLSHNNCFTLVTLRVVFSTATRMLYPQGFIVPLYRRCCESRCTISFRRGQLWDGVLSAEYKPLTRNLGCGKEPVESRNAQETSWRRSLMTRRWM